MTILSIVTAWVLLVSCMVLVVDHHYYHRATIVALEKKMQTEYGSSLLAHAHSIR